ncbi:DUF4136 domain-containing protein [Flavobacterium nackdongense]|uniref:DUF4136 domain-containing protein n=1 Tax=Flavobacterium nackdongense TaxID=2547394 RepID=A0A4P6Y603_9FLAO|nr:DUF4136 domain-containing protein [Flavobacterium nackdongense]QBN17686.1 hypothetical protein E1750_02335 [Flavobacterium nackdongense]
MKIKLFLSACIVGLLVSCGPSTQIVKTWSDPSLNGATIKPYNKVLVIAQLKDDSSRRIAEDKLVASSPRGNFVASYNYLKPSQKDQNLVVSELLKDGIEGIILMRLTDIAKTTDYVQGSTYYGGWGYGPGFYGGYGYGYGGGYYSTPGYYEENKTYYVETNIYDVKSNKLLWSGTTSTLNPTKANEALDEIILALKTELNNKGLIKKEAVEKKK